MLLTQYKILLLGIHQLCYNFYQRKRERGRERTGNMISSLRSPWYFPVLKRQVCKYIQLSSRRFADAEAVNARSKRNHASTLIIPSNSNNVSSVWKPEFYCTSILQNSIWGNQRDLCLDLSCCASIARSTGMAR